MKSAFSLALLAAASASEAILSTESSNPELNSKGLQALHEGAGLNGIYLSDSLVGYTYNETTNYIYPDGTGSLGYALRVFNGTLIAGIAGDTFSVPSDGYLTVNGSSNVFYACKPVPFDPYGYSKKSYGIAVYAEGSTVPDTCESLKINALV